MAQEMKMDLCWIWIGKEDEDEIEMGWFLCFVDGKGKKLGVWREMEA